MKPKPQGIPAAAILGHTSESQMACQYPGCQRVFRTICDLCATRFCPEHGTRCLQRLVGDKKAFDRRACWKCGGFNADA